MAAIVPWERTGFGPFLPLLPSNIGKLVVLKGLNSELRAGIFTSRIPGDETLNILWSPRAEFPKDMQWQMVDFGWFANYRNSEKKQVGLILLPSAFSGMNRKEMKRKLQALWDALLPGDILMIGSVNNLPGPGRAQNRALNKDGATVPGSRAFDSLRTYRFLKALGSSSRAYVCLGRNGLQALNLVSTRYGLQRKFIADVIPSMGPVKRLAYRLLANIGAYPWIEKEHILVAEKC